MTAGKTAIIGYPVKKSKSALIYRHWMEAYGIDGQFDVLEMPPAELESGIRHLIDHNYAGFCVTVPHKEIVMAFCNDVDDRARQIGATNSVRIKEGKLYATNTDAYGFIQNIKSERPRFDFSYGPAVVLGAGGAARAVVYGLLEQGTPEIRITNRTRTRAEDIAKMSSRIVVIDWEEREEALAAAALLINTTTLGMEGQDPLEIQLDNLPTTALVNDIVYYPLYTDLLKSAAEHANPVVTGIGMLVHQARPSFKNWYGIDPDVTDELKQKVLA
jgi:shikimate dehydrogenase